MNIGELVLWAVIGLVVGWRTGLTAGAVGRIWRPERVQGGLHWVVLLGVLSALLGGWTWVLLFGDGPSTFLGAAAVGVLGAIGCQRVLWRQGRSALHA